MQHQVEGAEPVAGGKCRRHVEGGWGRCGAGEGTWVEKPRL